MSGSAKHVWVAEAYYTRRWYTLWTTCRLYRFEALEAVKEHPSIEDFDKIRVVKFTRTLRSRGKEKA